jgi:hypothetical protein
LEKNGLVLEQSGHQLQVDTEHCCPIEWALHVNYEVLGDWDGKVLKARIAHRVDGDLHELKQYYEKSGNI